MQILLRDLHITVIPLTLRVAYCPLCSRLPSRQIVLHALYNLNLLFFLAILEKSSHSLLTGVQL